MNNLEANNINRGFSRSPIRKKTIDHENQNENQNQNQNQNQNLNINIDDLIRHLNFLEYFFEMEIVKKFFIKKN